MDAPTPAGPGPGFDDLAATAARLADLTTLLVARLDRTDDLEQRIAGVTGLVQATHEELNGVRTDLATIDERLTTALAAVTRTSTRVDLLTEQSLDAAAGIAANVARSVETSTASAAQAGRVAERMWADVTGALAAFSGEATQAVGAVAVRVDQAERVAAAAMGNAQRLEAIVRTELIGMRQAVRAVADQVATGLGPAPLDITEDVRRMVAGELGTLATTTAEAIEAAVASAQSGTEAAASLTAGLEEVRRVVHEAEGRQDAQLRQAIAALRSANVIASEAAAGVAEKLAGDTSLALGSVREQVSDAMSTVREGALAAVGELESATARAVTEASARMAAGTDAAVAAIGARSDALLSDALVALGRETPADLSRLVRAELLGVRQALLAAVTGIEDSAAATAADVVDRLAALEGATAAATTDLRAVVEAAAQRERPEPVEPLIARMSSDLQTVIASLLSEQLAAIDQRQNVIEDGLRAMWHRLDELDTALGATGTPDPAVAELTAAIARALPTWEGAQAALVDVRASLPAELAELPGRMYALTQAISSDAETRAANGSGDLPDVVAEVVGAQLSASLAPLAERLSDLAAGRVAAATGALVERISEVATALAERVSDAAVTQVTATMGRVGDLPVLVEGLRQSVGELQTLFETSIGGLPQRTADAVRRAGEELAEGLTLELAPMRVVPDRTAQAVSTALAALAGTFRDELTAGMAELPARVGEVVTQAATEMSMAGANISSQTAAAVAEAVVGVNDVPERTAAAIAEATAAVRDVPERTAAAVGEVTAGVRDLPGRVAEAVAGATAGLTAELESAPWRLTEAVSAATADLTAELASAPGRIADSAAEMTRQLAGLDARVGELVAAGVGPLPAAVAAEVAGTLPAAIGPDVAAAVVSAVGADLGGRLADEASGRLAAEVATRLAAEVGLRLADEVGGRLAAEVGGRVAAEVGARLADDIAGRLAGGIGADLAADVATRASAAITSGVRDQVAEEVRGVLADSGAAIGAEVTRALASAGDELVQQARRSGDDAARALEAASEASVTNAASRAAAEATSAILTAVHDVYASITGDLVRDAVAAIEAHLPAGSLAGVTEQLAAGIRSAAAADAASARTLSAVETARTAAEGAQERGAEAVRAAEAAGRDAAEAAAAVRSLVDAERTVVLDEGVLGQIVASATAALAEHISAPTGPVVANIRPAVQVAVDAALAGRLQGAVDAALAARLKTAIDEVMGPRVQATVEAARMATADAAADAAAVAAERAADAAATAATDATTAALARIGQGGVDTAELAAVVAGAVAATLDEFGARVDSDLDGLEERLAALAGVLEGVVVAVQDALSRRRGASTEALDLLRQVAADQGKPRRGRGSV